VASGVTRHTDTVDVAGVVFRLSCRFPKPSFWARRHPRFISLGHPDVTVQIEYDDNWRRTRRSMGDTVSDAADVRRDGRCLLVSTGYYRAVVDAARGRVSVQIAAGFEVSGLMRTLAALWLLERGTLLLNAACFGSAASATLACGPDGGLVPSSAVAGWLAVTPLANEVRVRSTPFVERVAPLRSRAWRATMLWLPGSAPAPRSIGAAPALRALLPAIWQADRRRAAVERTLDLATRIVTALECREVGVIGAPADEALVG
jgi:hypothetical protein